MAGRWKPELGLETVPPFQLESATVQASELASQTAPVLILEWASASAWVRVQPQASALALLEALVQQRRWVSAVLMEWMAGLRAVAY